MDAETWVNISEPGMTSPRRFLETGCGLSLLLLLEEGGEQVYRIGTITVELFSVPTFAKV